MKIAVISDVHANPTALEKVLVDAKEQGCERTICLGDIVGYGYDPVSCIDICRKNNLLCVKGNHDAGLIGELSLEWFSPTARYGIEWQRGKVNEEHRRFLEALAYNHTEELGNRKVAFAHGSFNAPEYFDYIQNHLDAAREMWFMKERGYDILFVGHTHYASTFVQDADEQVSEFLLDDAPDLSVNLKNWAQAIVNVGSVGYPRNQRKSIYVIFDTEEMMVHYRSLSFDFRGYKDELIDRTLRIPLWLADFAERK